MAEITYLTLTQVSIDGREAPVILVATEDETRGLQVYGFFGQANFTAWLDDPEQSGLERGDDRHRITLAVLDTQEASEIGPIPNQSSVPDFVMCGTAALAYIQLFERVRTIGEEFEIPDPEEDPAPEDDSRWTLN